MRPLALLLPLLLLGCGPSDADDDGYPVSEDCDDEDPSVYPGAEELCNGVDDDCDDLVDDEATDATTWYPDVDLDGYGDPESPLRTCSIPEGYVLDATDCDDTDPSVNPEGIESCNEKDDDCDGTTDGTDAIDLSTWYRDLDADGYGDAWTTTGACDQPSGYVADDTDCEDDPAGVGGVAGASIYPGAVDVWYDGVDADCEGDDDFDQDGDAYAGVDEVTTYEAGGGTYSGSLPVSDCIDDPVGEAGVAGEDIHPGAVDAWYDGVDADCAGDDDFDQDGDLYAGADEVATYEAGGAVYDGSLPASDCIDDPAGDGGIAGADIRPGATDTWYDGVDADCAGDDDFDQDGDLYAGADEVAAYEAGGAVYDGSLPARDCIDDPAGDGGIAGADIHPGAVDTWYDGVDADCVGDDDFDQDGDLYASEAGVASFEASGGAYTGSLPPTDCNDLPGGDGFLAGDQIHPDAEDAWYDGVDADCVGDDDFDQDGDGHAAEDEVAAYEAAGGTYDGVLPVDDCVDDDDTFHPEVDEVCDDDEDHDCDGSADNGCPIEHCGHITEDETWSADHPHLVTCNVAVQGPSDPTLTIEDGVVVTFSADRSLAVADTDEGRIEVLGTDVGVLFTSAAETKTPGDYKGLKIDSWDLGSRVEGLTVEYGGQHRKGGIWIYGSSPEIVDCEVRYNDVYGIYADHGAEPTITGTFIHHNEGDGFRADDSGVALSDGTSFVDNVISDNTGYPLVIDASYAGELDPDSNELAGNTSDYVVLVGVTVGWDSTWHDLDVPYLVTGKVLVQGSADPELVIEDGVVAWFDGTGELVIGDTDDGVLTVQGTSEGVWMDAIGDDPEPGDWRGLRIDNHAHGSTVVGLSLMHGGANGWGCLWAAKSEFEVHDSTVSHCAGHALYTTGVATITGSTFSHAELDGVHLTTLGELSTVGTPSFTGNTLTHNGAWPLTIPAWSVGQVAGESLTTIASNGEASIRVLGGMVSEDAVWREQAVPYRWVDDSAIQDATNHPEVVIEDGVHILADHGVRIHVADTQPGALAIAGTDEGVVMTTSDPDTPGTWEGLYYDHHTVEAASWIEGLTIERAGDSIHGAIRLQDTSLTITDSEVLDSQEAGIYVDDGTLELVDTLVEGSATYGVEFIDHGRLETSDGPTFTGNTLTASGTYPISLHADSVGQLDSSSRFDDNGVDAIRIVGGIVASDATWQLQEHDVVYEVAGDTTVQGASDPVLTLEPGVVVEFAAAAKLQIGDTDDGGLVAEGTDYGDGGIVFTSAAASPEEGDWDGLYLDVHCTEAVLDYLTVAWGGNNGKGNIYFNKCAATVDHARVWYSSQYGTYVRGDPTPSLGDIDYDGNLAGPHYEE